MTPHEDHVVVTQVVRESLEVQEDDHALAVVPPRRGVEQDRLVRADPEQLADRLAVSADQSIVARVSLLEDLTVPRISAPEDLGTVPVLAEQQVPLVSLGLQRDAGRGGHPGAVEADPLEHRSVPGLQHGLEGLGDEATPQPVVGDDVSRPGPCVEPGLGAFDHGDRPLRHGHGEVGDTPVPPQLGVLTGHDPVDRIGVARRRASVEALEVDRVLGLMGRGEVGRVHPPLVERAQLVGASGDADPEPQCPARADLQPHPGLGDAQLLGGPGNEVGTGHDPDGASSGVDRAQGVAPGPGQLPRTTPLALEEFDRRPPGAVRLWIKVDRDGLAAADEGEVERAHLARPPALEPECRHVAGDQLHVLDHGMRLGVTEVQQTRGPRVGQQARVRPPMGDVLVQRRRHRVTLPVAVDDHDPVGLCP